MLKNSTKLLSITSFSSNRNAKNCIGLENLKKKNFRKPFPDYLSVEKQITFIPRSNLNGTIQSKPFYTSYSKLSEVKLITLGLATPERIKQWAEKTLPNGKIFGKVINANTLHHKTFKPQKGGLFCERIFGPLKDFSCSCGKLNNLKKYKTELKNSLIKMNSNEFNSNDPTRKISLRKFCPDCDVEYTWSVIRRYQLGYIELVSPVTHVWYIKSNPSYLSILLDMKKRHLEFVTYNSETLTLENSLKKTVGLEFGVTPSEIFSSWKKLMESQTQLKKENSLSKDVEKLSNQTTPKIDAKFPVKSFFLNSTNEGEKILSASTNQNLIASKRSLKREQEIQKRKLIEPIQKSNWLKFYFSFLSTTSFKELMEGNFILNSSSVLKNLFFGNEKKLNLTHYVKFFNLYYKWNFLSKNPSFLKNFKQPSFSVPSNLTNFKANLKDTPIPFYIFFNLEFMVNQASSNFSNEIILKHMYKKLFILTIEQKRKILFKLMTKNNKFDHLLVNPSLFFFEQFSEIVSQQKFIHQIFQILNTSETEQYPLNEDLNQTQLVQPNNKNSLFLEISGPSLSVFNYKFLQTLILKEFTDQFFKHNTFVDKFIENSAHKLAKLLIKQQIKFLKTLSHGKKESETHQYSFKGKSFETKSLNTFDRLQQIISLIYKEKKLVNLQKQDKSIISKINSEDSHNLTNMNPSYVYNTNVLKNDVSKLFLITKKRNVQSFHSNLMELKDLESSFKFNEIEEMDSSFFIDVNPTLFKLKNSKFTFFENVIKTKHFDQIQINSKQIRQNKRHHAKLLSVYFTKLNENLEKKGLVSNIYMLSHRQRWEMERDWNYFRLFFIPKSNSTDIVIPIYKHRIINSQISIYPSSSYSFQKSLNQTKYKSQMNPNLKQTSLIKQSNLSPAFYSGPGIVNQMLNEFTFSELKKMDSQNRILLYHLNKHVFRLKTQLTRLAIQKKNMSAKLANIYFEKSSFPMARMDEKNSYPKLSNSKMTRMLKKELKESYKKRDLLIRRTKLVRKLFTKDSNPQSMILTVLPVLPPDLRPIVKIGGQIAASDLNRLYQRVIYRNDRLKKFLNDPATNNSYEMKYAQRLLQEAVDNLISNGKSGVTPEKDARGRLLKSLSDILKGKQGRFRQYLLGKRVDYSGRSVIVVGPTLKLHECGIPKEMALELYLPFLLKRVLNQNLARTVVGAKTLIKNNPSLAWELLKEIMQACPVLLNRAPTLHRLGIQAFQPKLIEGRAILLHPLVCSAFNADFDGDQMAVHIPITIEARAEAWKLMLSRNNLLSPATGEPLAIPSQDMVLGCYYLTTNCNQKDIKNQKGSGFYFKTFSDVLKSFENKQLDLHSIIWVQWNEWIENGTDHEEPLEIRLDSYGNYNEIYSKSQKQYDSKNRLVTQYVATTPGRVLFNQMIQICKR